MKKSKIVTSLSLLLIVAVAFPTFINIGKTTTTTKLYIEPSSIIDPGLPPNSNITISIKVDDVTDLYSWQVKIYYNPYMLLWTAAWYPTGHVFDGKPFQSVVPSNATDAEGTYVLFFATLVGETPGFTGSGILCKMNFTIKSIGSSELKFSRPLGATTWLLDSMLEKIPFEAQDGYVDNKPPPSPAALYVDPPRIINPTLVNCSSFTINVKIKNATQLISFAFKLGFDPALLNAESAQPGPFLPPGIIPIIQIDNTSGYVAISAALQPSDPPLNGDGILANITFHVESLGFCDLNLYETSLINVWSDPIPHEVYGGYFNNMMMAKLAVEPPLIRDPRLVPYEEFEINITVAEVEDLYGYEFKLGYDPSILACIRLTIKDVFGETHYIPNFYVNNVAGIVWVNVSYFSPAVPISTISPVTLVELKFRVIGRGVTPLDLHDTNLEDSSGTAITHEAYDGIFIPLTQDGALVDVTPWLAEAYESWIVNINVTVKNEGDLAENFTVKVYYEVDQLIGTIVFTDVNPDEEVTLTVGWNTKGVKPCYNYTIWAEVLPLPYETDLTDNVFVDGQVRIILMGDVNRDCVVDGLDISIVARAFGSDPTHSRWKPEADLNGDGVIDGLDIAKVARNYGKQC